MITGWGVHMNDLAQWGHGSDRSGPVEFEATGEFPDRGLFDVHVNFQATATYPDGVKLVCRTGDVGGAKFIGTDGWIRVTRTSLSASRPEWIDKSIKRGDPSALHMQNFLECMRTRQDPVAPVEVGHRTNSLCIIMHIGMKLGRKLRWDPDTERFVGDEEANRMLDYSHRKPWTV